MTPIALYWSGGGRPNGNFGDALSPLIVAHLARRPVAYAKRDRADLAAIGSILDGFEKKRWRRWLRLNLAPVHVWGAGYIHEGGPAARGCFSFHLVRGPHTRRRVDPAERLPMGDPGLIAGDLLDAPPEKTRRWGVIPHISHSARPEIDAFVANTRGAERIDLMGDTLSILRRIAACDRVVSTSLHGLITADSLGIPNHRLTLPPALVGGEWKFADYFDSVGRADAAHDGAALPSDLDAAFGTERAPLAYGDGIERRKRDIRGSFPAAFTAAGAAG